jgi:mortality factor 4-like protein 1
VARSDGEEEEGGEEEEVIEYEEEQSQSSSTIASNTSTHENHMEGPSAKFEVRQQVMCRDADGLLYQAIIRRSLFGVHHHKQVQVGMYSSQHEMDEYLEKYAEPTWHYFAHYLKWKVNWDRWVSEDDVLELNDETKELANLLHTEHRALQKQFKGNKKSKHVDGGAFLRAWKQKLVELEEERTGKSKRRKVSAQKDEKTGWNESALAKERKLRERDLTLSRKPIHAQKIVLPFSLKKVLVEEWEVISQCQMVPALPAKVTIRQALDQYLETKGVTRPAPKKDDDDDDVRAVDKSNMDTSGVPDEAEPKETAESNETKEEKNEAAAPMETEQAVQPNETATKDTPPPSETAMEEDEETQKKNKEWIDMTSGIALFFDQALPFRLLYQQELPQHQVIEADDEGLGALAKSDVYGCEHLLRLFLRLPPIMADQWKDEDDEEARLILAKINDLVRFLHKHQSTLFCGSYRKQSAEELKEQQKITTGQERKRKRAESSGPATTKKASVIIT